MKKTTLFFCLYYLKLLNFVYGGECDMTAIVSFQSCVFFCVNKYGTDPATQRKYYNRFTGNCQKAVICPTTAFRVYQNRCLQDFQSFSIGDQQVSLPQIYQQIIVIMIHGNNNAINKTQMCYPGFFSSKNKIKIGVQVYQQYFCDIPIGSNPQTFPQSHGQYFFYQLPISNQVAIVQINCPKQKLIDIQFGFLFASEIVFVIIVVHYHIALCIRKIRRWRRKIYKQRQTEIV